MALTLIGRWQLAGPPYRPAMETEGVLVYRPTTTTLRKAVWNVSDAALATIAASASDNASASAIAKIQGGYYLAGWFNTGVEIMQLQTVNVATGAVAAVSSNITGSGTTGNIINYPSVNRFGSVVKPPAGAVTNAFWTDIPAAINPNVTSGGAFSPDNFAMGIFNEILTGVNPYTIVCKMGMYTIDGLSDYEDAWKVTYVAGGLTVSRLQRFSYLYIGKLKVGEGAGLNGPMHILPDGNGHYWGFIRGSGRTYLSSWDAADMDGTPSAHQTFYLLDRLVPGGGSLNDFWNSAIALNATWNKIYVASSNLLGFYHAKLPWVGPATQPLGDTTPGAGVGITGIWTFPPYVYVSKTASSDGGSQHQLIKFYDSDLGPRRHRRRHFGGELWDVIPEVAPYLG